MSGWYIPQDLFRSLSQSQLSKKQGKMNGMLNNSAIGQKKGKLLMKKDLGAVPKNIGHNVSPEPSVTREHNYDGVTPAKQNGDKLSTRFHKLHADKDALSTKPIDTSAYGAVDAVSEKLGTKHVTDVTPKPRFTTNMKDFKLNSPERRAEYTRRGWAQDETTSAVPKLSGHQLRDAVTTTKNMAEGKKFEDTYMQRDEDNPVYDTKKPKGFWGRIQENMSRFPSPVNLTVQNIMKNK